MNRKLAFALGAALVCVGSTARAQADVSLAPSGGLAAITVKIDLAQKKLRFGKCASAPCALTDEEPIKLEGTADASKVTTTNVDLGGGRHALWVHVPGDGGSAFDAVLVGGGARPIVYAEETGKIHGQPGSLSGSALELVPRAGGASFVARGIASEDYGMCGRPALANLEVLAPQTLDWHRASFVQLSADDIASATAITATARQVPAEKPLASLLAPRLASSGAHPAAIADLDPSTAWSEDAAGAGRGQFVVFSAPSEVPLVRLAITIAPQTPSPSGAAPKTFYLATNDKLFSVTVPEDAWQHPGRAYDITFPEPLQTSCLALVLDDAYVRAGQKPDVSIAELTAYSALDVPDASLDTVAADLGVGGRRAEIAAAILKRAGNAALAPVARAWPKLDTFGKENALDAAEGASCGKDATRIFLSGLCDADMHVARKAEGALGHRCLRTSGIVEAAASFPKPTCSRMPEYVALLGRQNALPTLAGWLAATDGDMRATVRHDFATAANADGVPAQLLASMIRDPKYAAVRLALLRAMAPRLAEIRADAIAALDALLAPGADMPTRYLALEPLAALAKSGDSPSAARVAAMLARDPDWPVRRRAAELARDLPAVQSELVSAIADPSPRVRETALDTLAALRVSPAAVGVEKLLGSDPWTFVRVAAAKALGAMPAARDLDKSLSDALEDKAPQVRGAILDALAAHHAREYASAVRARLDDAQELPSVRTSAAHALGAMCDPAQLERLTELARAAADPTADAEDIAVGIAAVGALGDMHPADLASRLASLRDKSVRMTLRGAAEHALVAPAKCR
ncbi:MAG TPA: HEAT repeat domain-containing protein [Polyangiaceae bacterium]